MALLSIGEILDLGNSANMSSYIPYSALDYDPTGAISGISGSAIAGGVDSSVVSSIVSSMVSGKADQSALEDCCSSMSSVVSSIQNDVSGISSYVSGLTGEYLEKSASSMFAPSGNYMSASESSSFYPMTGNPSGFLTGVDLSDYATTAYVDSSVSGKMDATASGYLQPSGDYAYNSSLSSYLYASASSLFQSAGNYQTAGDYAYNSAVSSKLDASASSEFYLTSNPSGFITGVDLSEYQPTSAMTAYQPSGDYAYNSSMSSYIAYSALSGSDNRVTAISGSALGGVIPPTTQLILDDATMSGLIDPLTQDFYIGVKSGVFAMDSGMTAYATTNYVDSSVSSKLDESAFTSYTATSIPIVIVGNSSEATAANVVYVVTGVPE